MSPQYTTVGGYPSTDPYYISPEEEAAMEIADKYERAADDTVDTAALRDSNMNSINYANRAPLCCSAGIETGPPIIKPSRNYGWLIWPALVLGFGVVIAIASI